MRSRWRTTLGLWIGLSVLGVFACGPESVRPDLVIITLDTTRADHLGCYGYFRDTSPNIDALADQSILFERCLAPMATTLPTHVSLLTATYPYEHGVLANLQHGGLAFTPADGLRSFAEVCEDLGYETAAFVSAAPLKSHSGIDAGFQTFDAPKGWQRRADETNERVLNWLSRRPERPLLLWVHYFDPHAPYNAPPPFGGSFAVEPQLDAYIDARGIGGALEAEIRQYRTRKAHNDYDAEIRFLDSEVARLLEALDTSVPQASILLLADHGEGLHQHGEPNHGKTWREQIHVPCMMRIPGHDRRRVSEVVSVVDVLPTWLAALGFEGGERFLARARGRDALAPGFVSTPVLSQDSENPNKGSLYRTSLTVDRWKYFLVRTGEDGYSEELYDLQEDPFERNDLAAEAQGEARRVLLDLREELLEQIRSQQARGLQLDSAENRPALDPDRIEELRSLGYTQ